MAKRKKKAELIENPKGLGDTVHNILTKTGIKDIVDKVADTLDTDCGCQQRQDFLNKILPYQNDNNGKFVDMNGTKVRIFE